MRESRTVLQALTDAEILAPVGYGKGIPVLRGLEHPDVATSALEAD